MEYTLKANGLHVLELIKRPEMERVIGREKLKVRIRGHEREKERGKEKMICSVKEERKKARGRKAVGRRNT